MKGKRISGEVLDAIVSVGVDVDCCRTTIVDALCAYRSGVLFDENVTNTHARTQTCMRRFPPHTASVCTFALGCCKVLESPVLKYASQNCTPRPCNTTLPRTQTQRGTLTKINRTPARTPHPSASGVFCFRSNSGHAIYLSFVFPTSRYVRLFSLLFSTTTQALQ